MKQNAHELMERLMRMQWLLNRYFHRNLRDRGVPYSGQGRVLKVLKMKPESPQKELSEILGMRPQSIGELLSKLEKKGFITRTPSPNDKRVIIVHLTEKGAGAEESENSQPGPDDIFGCLSEEEQSTFKEYLDRMIDDLEERCGEGGERRRRCRRSQEFSSEYQEDAEGNDFDRRQRRDRFFRG